jgi:hypothetical protein
MKIKNYKCSGTVILIRVQSAQCYKRVSPTNDAFTLHMICLRNFCKIWGLIKISGAEFFIEKLLTVLKYDIWQYLILHTRGSGGRLTQVTSWSTVHVFPSVALWTEHATVCRELLHRAKNDILFFGLQYIVTVFCSNYLRSTQNGNVFQNDSHSKCNTRSECSKRRTPLWLNPL